jgi:RimJ/RimL family protein N-acetyltransferase
VSLPLATLRDGDLELAPYSERGWRAIAAWNGDRDHQRWFDWPVDAPTDRAAALWVVQEFRRRWAEGREYGFMAAAAREVVGWCSIQVRAPGLGEIAFGTVPAARRRGFAARAVRLAAAWAFEALALERLELRADARNAGSRAVARAAGFAEEAVMRDALAYTNAPGLAGTRGDLVMHARLAEDAAASRA